MKLGNKKTPESIEVIQVVKTLSVIGEGTEESPARRFTRYWTMDGKLLCEKDDLNDDLRSRFILSD